MLAVADYLKSSKLLSSSIGYEPSIRLKPINMENQLTHLVHIG